MKTFDGTRWNQNTNEIVNVRDFGAVGDGIADDTPAFQAAMDEVGSRGGGTLLIPAGGDYYLHSSVNLVDNVKISAYGAILRKKSGRYSYSSFAGISNGLGYGAGPSNISFEGGTYVGQFGSGGSGNSITIHHSSNVTVRDVRFTEAIMTGHALDLGGCSDIVVDNCIFEGSSSSSKPYTEAIQLDYSTAMGVGGENGTHDGLPTKKVTVQNCSFIPLTIDGTTYPAPNGLGNHNRVEGMWITDIKFLNNYMEGGIDTQDYTSGINDYFSGWVHLFHVKDVLIQGNTFKAGPNQRATNIINMSSPSTGTLLVDVDNPSPTSGSIPVNPPTSIKITENIFEGFKAAITGNNGITVEGSNSSNRAKDITISKNTFRDFSPSEGSSPTTEGPTCVVLSQVDTFYIGENHFSVVHRAIHMSSISKGKVEGNHTNGATLTSVIATSGGNLIFSNNYTSGQGGIWANALTNFTATNNIMSTEPGTTGTSAVAALITTNGCTNIIVSNNTLTNVAGSTYTQRAVNIYGSSSTGFIMNNIIRGSYTIPVDIKSDSNTVSSSGNVILE